MILHIAQIVLNKRQFVVCVNILFEGKKNGLFLLIKMKLFQIYLNEQQKKIHKMRDRENKYFKLLIEKYSNTFVN